METAVLTAFWVTAAIAPVAWITTVVSAVLAVANRKPGVRLWHDAPFFNPFNHLLVTEHLTDKGLRHRRRAAFAIAAFVVPIIVSISLAALTGNL